MFLHPNKRAGRRLGLAAVLLLTAAPAAADILVVRSAGPSAKTYPAGKALKEDTRVTLQANDMLVVLDGRGTRTLRGPGSFLAGGPAPASMRAAAAPTGQRRARIGAVRSVGLAPRSPSVWHVDVSKSSNICVADPTNVQLWRPDASRPVTLTVSGTGGGSSRTVAWDAGQSIQTWPKELSVADGASYRLNWAGAPQPTTLTFKTLTAKPVGLEDMASSLILNDCTAQLDLLIETVRLPEDGAAAPG